MREIRIIRQKKYSISVEKKNGENTEEINIFVLRKTIPNNIFFFC